MNLDIILLILNGFGLKLDISDSDIPLKLSTWLDISVEPPCVTSEN